MEENQKKKLSGPKVKYIIGIAIMLAVVIIVLLAVSMPTRACFLVVPTTTVRLVLLTKSAQTYLSIKVWLVLQIQALRHLIAVAALPLVKE